MSKIRVGIIGMGRMGITHTAILRRHPGVEVVGLADTSRLMRYAFGKYVRMKGYKSFEQLFAEGDLDAAIVCTPPSLHYRVAMTALEAGCHAFVEKPLTASSGRASELSQAYEDRGLVNQVGYVNRFNDAFRSAREMVQAGLIGEVKECRSTMLSGTVLKRGSGGWRGAKAAGGGVIYEMASHAIDLLSYMVGPFSGVAAVEKRKIFSLEVEDAVQAELVGNSGCRGFLEVNWSDTTVRKPTNRVELVGEQGRIQVNQHGMVVEVGEDHPEWNLRQGENQLDITSLFKPVPFYLRGNEFTAQLFHFVDCIESGTTVTNCSFREGARTLHLLELLDQA